MNATRRARLAALADLHDMWVTKNAEAASAAFDPKGRPAKSVYNQHHVDLDADGAAQDRYAAGAARVLAAGAQTAAYGGLHEFCRNPLHPGPCKGWKQAKAAGRDSTVAHPDLAPQRRPRAKKKSLSPSVGKEVPAPAQPFHRSIGGLEDLVAMAEESSGAPREKLYGGQSAATELVRLPDGRAVVHKRGLDWGDPDPEVAQSIVDQADAEQLTSLMAQALEVPAARVYRTEPNAVWMEYIDKAGFDISDEAIDSPEGIRIGLLDALAANQDRGPGNLLVKNDRPVAIDHGWNWGSHIISGNQWNWDPTVTDLPRPAVKAGPEDPIKHFVESDNYRWRDNPLHPDDVETIRAKLQDLRPDFAKLGRENWLDYSLSILDKIEPHAKGEIRLWQ